MANRYEVRLCGHGGQGIIRAGYIIGQAVSIFESRSATLIQDYGPAARGGACRTDIISVKAMRDSMLASVPKNTEELNTEAFERGYAYGCEKLI